MPFLFAALLLVADPSASAANTATAPADTAKPVKEKKICKVDENESSSRLRKRVCLTQTEWERKEAGKTAGDLKNIGAQ
jgi:predicted transglutaminase-like cysteine proteinase